jgi:hypothetical protein
MNSQTLVPFGNNSEKSGALTLKGQGGDTNWGNGMETDGYQFPTLEHQHEKNM